MVPEKFNFTDCAEYRTRQNSMHSIECESDDDCEVYFLKPVNEYNIVDKIKEANKELFAECEESLTMINSQRKVTFATNLEDYEPEENAAGASSVHEVEENEEDDTKYRSTANLKFSDIDEEEELLENKEEDRNHKKLQQSESYHDNIIENPIEINEPDNSKTSNDQNETTEAVEEICEEIITMDMEESDSSVKECQQQQQRHKMLKQPTFDHDIDGIAVIADNEDNSSDIKSPSNQLPSESKEEESHLELADDEDDDDDQLSIIVASYIPDNFEKQSELVDGERKQTHKFAKPKKMPFSKHFSFRRKSGNSKSVNCYFGDRHMPPPEVTDLKLSYKTCCEYRHAVQEKLPKYTGYLSEYGLTREQLAKREEKIKKKQRFVLEKSLTANEQEMRKMQDNERAFTTWLKQKMRFPINKTRNMFDVKRIVGVGGCGSASVVRNRCNSGKKSS